MVLENVASSLLSFFLTKYIDKVNTNALKMSLFTGKVSLDDLSIKKTALMQHKLPFKIVRGIVKKIFVSIPYIHFKSKPTLANINNIFVLGKLSEKILDQTDQLSTKESDIPDEFNSIDSALKEQKVSTFDFTTGIIGAIIENLQIKITNIHVRLEYELNESTVAIGLIVPLIQVMSIDENGNEIPTNNSKTKIRKKLILSNLSIYVDTKCEHYKEKAKKENIDFEQLMLDSMTQSHQFILHNFTFETIYEHAKPGQGPVSIGNLLNATISAIKLALDSLQYRCFAQIMNHQSRLMIKKFFSSCGKPNSYPENDSQDDDCLLWWRFAERCSEKKNQPYKFNPTTALIFLKNRNENLKKLSDILINPNPKKDEKYLKSLQEKYGGDVFLMFRAYAKFRTEKQLRDKKQKEMEEMRKKNKSEIAKQSKEIQQLLSQKENIKNNADTWLVKFKVSEIDLGLLFTPKSSLANLEWKAWEGTFKMNKDDIEVEALIGDMSIVNMQSKNHTKIIELIKSEKTKGGSATVNIVGNLASRLFKIDSIVTSPHLFADLSIINQVQMFLSGTSFHVEGSVPKVHKRDHTHAEIVNRIDRHSKLFINLHLDSPVVTVPYKMPIQILLGNVDVKSIKPDRKRSIRDKQSWYDEYSLDLTGFQILLDKKMFCKPVTFSLNCLQSFIRKSSIVMTIAKTNISSISFDMNNKQYRMLLELPEYINDFIKPTPNQIEMKEEHKKEETHAVVKKQNTIGKVDSLVSDLSVQFNVDFEELGLKLLNSRNVQSELKVAGISTGIKALQNKADGTFVLQYIKVLGDTNQCICNFGNEKDPAINIDVHVQGIEVDLSMHTSKPKIDVDFTWLGSLLNFVIVPKSPKDNTKAKAIEAHPTSNENKAKSKHEKTEKHVDVNQYQLVRKLEQHPIYKIEVVFAGPEINLPCGQSQIIINLGLLHIYTKDPIPRDPSNIESFYDMLSCDFNDFEIHLDNDFLLEPFSLTVEAHKAFIQRQDVESLKIFTDIHKLKLLFKRSQYLSLLSIVDSVKAIIPSSNKEKHTNHDLKEEKKHEHDSKEKSSGTNIPDSLYINLKFESLIIELLNENSSVHSGFTMNNLESSFNSFQEDINADLKIVVLKGVYNEETLLSFGEDNTPSFNFNVHNNKDETNVDICISKPIVLVDFQWIMQILYFFAIPDKVLTKKMLYELKDSSLDNVADNNPQRIQTVRAIKYNDKKLNDTEANEDKENNDKEANEDKENNDTEANEDKKYKDSKSSKDIEYNDTETIANNVTRINDDDVKTPTEGDSDAETQTTKKLTIQDSDQKNQDSNTGNKESKINTSDYKDRDFAIDSFNQISSDNQSNDSNDDEEPKEKQQNDSQISEQSSPTEKEESSTKAKATEPITSFKSKLKSIPKSYILKASALLIFIIVFHRYFFKYKFVSLLLISTCGSAYYYFIHKRNKSIQDSDSDVEIKETPIIKPKEEPNHEPSPKTIQLPKEDSKENISEESEEIPKVTQTRAVDLVADALKAVEPVAETVPDEEPEKPLTLLEQLQKVQGKFVITEPSITVVLIKKTRETIRMNSKIQELNLTIDQDQKGHFDIDGFQISVDERYLMKPFSIKISLSLQDIISIKLDLSAIVLDLQTVDYQLLLEIGDYIPAVLHSNQNKKPINNEESMLYDTFSESQTSSTLDSQSIQSRQQSTFNAEDEPEEEEEEGEEKKSKLPLNLDVKLNKIGLNIYEQKKKLFNFDINTIILSSTPEGKFDFTISSIICQDHLSSKNNTIISFATPTLVHMSESGNISVTVSPSATIFVKMEAINDLLSIFLPKEQILDFEKQKKKKHIHKHKHHHKHKDLHLHKHKHKHDKEKKEEEQKNLHLHKHKSKIMTISVDSQCFKVIFLDDSEIATLSLKKISFSMEGPKQAIKVHDIVLTDPIESNLYPSEVLGSEKGKAFSLDLSQNEIKIKLNRLILFANLKVISRVINTLVKNPLKLPPPHPSEEEEEEEKDEKTLGSKNQKNEEDKDIETQIVTTNNEKPKKKGKKLRLRFKYINITVPVSFNESNEMLDFIIDGDFSISSKMKLSVNHITTKFIQHKGSEHPPFIPNISFSFVNKENAMNLSIQPAIISVALDDIEAASLMAKSLGKFVSHLNLPHDDGIKKVKKKEEKTDHKTQEMSISVTMNKLQLILNSDRYQTVPLLRFMIKEFIAKYVDQKPSTIHCVFDSIDFMDIQYLTWKMLLESFSLQVSLMVTQDLISIDSSTELPININCAYQAIQLILSHIKTVSQTVSSKKLIDSKPPTFKVSNKSSKDVSIKRIKTNETFEMNPGVEKTFDFTRDEELEIKIGEDSRKIVTSNLKYPIFVDFQAVSQSLLESGTTLLISSILLFDNQINQTLYLFRQRTILIHDKLLEIPPGKQIPYTDLETLKTTNFVLTTEEESTKNAHSAFTIRELKKRAILLNCLFPNKKKLKLVISSKFDPITCSMIVKIQPNCVIHNQLPLDLFIRGEDKDEILHIKPGERAKTLIVDTSGLDFTAHFAVSTFGESIEGKNFTGDNIHNKVSIKTIDSYISAVPLKSIEASHDDKPSSICFAIEAKKSTTKPQFELVCFAPSLIFNLTGIELSCYNKVHKKKKIMEKFSPREKGSDPNQDGILIWSSDEYFKRKDTSRKLSLRISTNAENERKFCYENIVSNTTPQTDKLDQDYIGDDIIECLATHINGPIMLPTENPDIFIPLHYTVASAQPYSSSTLVSLTSQFAICNNTNKPFFIQPVILPKDLPESSADENGGKKKSKDKKKKKKKHHDKGQEVASAEPEPESETEKKSKKKSKKHHFKLHKKDHAKTSDDNDKEETEITTTTTEIDEETDINALKKKKKKHFHFKTHKKSRAKTDVEDNDTDIANDESTATSENQDPNKKKKKHKLHGLHLTKHKKHKKEDPDTALTSDLETTTATATTTMMNDNDDTTETDADDDDDETTTAVQPQMPAIDPKEYRKLLKFGDAIKIENTGKSQQIRLAAYGLLFAFKVDPESNTYTLINFSEPIHTTFAHEGLLFEIENQTLGVESLIIIKEAVFPQPINLLNDFKIGSHDVYLTQRAASKDDVIWKSTASPQSMSIVAYDVPFGGTDLILHYKKYEIPINLIRVNTPQKHHHIYYEVIVNKNNTKTIVVSEVPYEHEKKANFKFHFNIPVIAISLIDKLNREFALLTLQRLDFRMEIGKLNKIMFNMGAFQLDDLQPSATLKVVIAAYPDVAEGEDMKTKNLLEFSTSMFADTPLFTACKDLTLKCDPIILFVDLSFLSDAVTLMQTMFIIDNSNKSVLMSKPEPPEANSLSSIPMTAESLNIEGIKFTIFVQAHSSRPNLFKPVSSFLKAVPDITNGKIVLPSFHFEDCTMNAAYIQKEIVHPLIDAGIKQGLKLLFNTDIFMRSTGTKSASFAKKGEKLMNGQLQVLVQVPGSMILQGGETGLNVASKFLHNITFNKGTGVNRVNATAKDTMNSGVKALGHGFADAVTGIVKDPMKEKDKNGVGGVFVGIGKGLLGLITKPIAGILDASVASISAMRKAMNGEDADVIPPIRIAHALPMIQLSNYTDHMMAAKDVAQFSFQMSDITELYNQYVERYVVDDKTSNFLGVTQEFFFSADKDGTLIKKARIKSITEIHWDEETQLITMNVFEIANKTFEIHVPEQHKATLITEMINSRRIALGIGE